MGNLDRVNDGDSVFLTEGVSGAIGYSGKPSEPPGTDEAALSRKPSKVRAIRGGFEVPKAKEDNPFEAQKVQEDDGTCSGKVASDVAQVQEPSCIQQI